MIIICGSLITQNPGRRETETERDCRKGETNKNEVTKYMNLTFRKEGTEVKGWMTFIKREDKFNHWLLHSEIYIVFIW